jgi:16S rRNA processing protein RimM
MQAQDVVVVGRIGAPHGVRGWVRVSSFTEPAGNILDYRPWLLETGDTWRSQHPLEVKPHRQGYVARFADIEDRDEAGRLAGKHVAVARTQLPDLEPDEYYWRDLEGLAVWNSGVLLGVVDHLIDTGAKPLLVVVNDPQAGGTAEPRQTLIPFVAQHVAEVDLEARRIEVSWDSWDEDAD